MAGSSSIEWTDATWNPITGCTLVSEGCRNCYAARLAATRLKNHPSRVGLARLNAAGNAKFTGEVRFNEQWLEDPLRWTRPRMIFVCAHGDLFHEAVPDEWIDRVFAVMALAPRHIFQVLTKRPERARRYLVRLVEIDEGLEDLCDAAVRVTRSPCAAHVEDVTLPLANVWLGTSVEDQATADARIPHLLAAPAAIRFLSAEPLLGPIDTTLRGLLGWDEDWRLDTLTGHGWANARDDAEPHPDAPRIDWVIVGGESGPGARPMHPEWARSLRDQCAAADIPFFFKQWGEWSADALLYRTPEGVCPPPEMRVGRARSGRRLDGRTHSATPARGADT